MRKETLNRHWELISGWWMAGYCMLPLAFVLASAIVLSGCTGIQRTPPIQVWPDMKVQEKFKPQTEVSTEMFSDGRASRRPVAGTVAHKETAHLDTPVSTGIEEYNADGSPKSFTGKNPRTIDPALLKTGQTKFNTYCSPCHDRLGTGKGIVPTRWPAWQPSNLTEDRLKAYNDGEIYWVISNGRRTMPGYKYQITEDDRWAIVAYVRALQRASSGTIEDVPQELKAEVR